ncbi:MAG: hypothetical protein H6Q41_501 [Deltaproteobacteria bacterium]|jgi:hypothetical protein|nr:hypothetical protein [Deltaproteobacteria bacterium]
MENRVRKQWSFIGAGLIGLCILFFVFLKTCISPSPTQPDRAIVPGEVKPSPSIAEKKPPEPPKGVVGLPRDGDALNSGQPLNRTESGREDQEKLSREGAVSNSHPYRRQEEKERHESKLFLSKKKQASPIKVVRVEQEVGREMDFPIGTVISQGNVKMEVKDKVWRTLESPYSPMLKGKKIRTGNGTARISLSNNSLIEVSPNSLLSFEHEGQLNLLEGGVHFKIPATAQMNFKIGALSVRKPQRLTTQKGPTTALIREEETEGSLFLHPDGSLRVRSVQGSLSILDHENRVLTTTSSNGPITITPKILSGEEAWRAEQRIDAPAPEMKEKLLAPIGKERNEVDELEKYLIEFSIHLKDKDLPVDLDVQKFFSLLAAGYPHQDHIEKVKQYPVKVRREGRSYVLTVCDKQSEWMLYKDLGETTHTVDNIYDPEERTVRCREALPLYWLLTVPAAAVATGVVWYEVDKHNDHKDTIPLCP